MTDGFALKSWVISLMNKISKKNNKYSTNETQVGTWIDGKPIYRKVVKVENPALHSATPLTEANVDTLVNAVICANRFTSAPDAFQIYPVFTGGVYFTPYVNIDNHKLYLSNEATGNSTSTITKAIVTIEYTKTTDKATS